MGVDVERHVELETLALWAGVEAHAAKDGVPGAPCDGERLEQIAREALARGGERFGARVVALDEACLGEVVDACAAITGRDDVVDEERDGRRGGRNFDRDHAEQGREELAAVERAAERLERGVEGTLLREVERRPCS